MISLDNDIQIDLDLVIIMGVPVPRPPNIARSEWERFWWEVKLLGDEDE